MRTIYLDNNATTPCDPAVADAVRQCMAQGWGNPSSAHALGRAAREAVRQSAERLAGLLDCDGREIVFTSGATESIHLAIRGLLARGARPGCRRIVTSTSEHGAVNECLAPLAARGWEVVEVRVDRDGLLDLEQFRESLDDRTALASLTHVNSETGVIADIPAAAEIAAARGVPLHVDATQAAGRLPLHMRDWPGVSLLSLSAHKFHGPMGVGALFVRRGTRLAGQIPGPQQGRLRGGTENVPGIVGLGLAAERAGQRLPETIRHCTLLRDQLLEGILRRIRIAVPHGLHAPRVCNTLSVGFADLEAGALVEALSARGVCVSAGSACSSGTGRPSHVLLAMGVPEPIARGTIRLSLSPFTTADDVDTVLEVLPDVVALLAAARGRCQVVNVPGRAAAPGASGSQPAPRAKEPIP